MNVGDFTECGATRANLSPTADPPRLYYPELDGLRFIAFLLVFIHHAPPLANRVLDVLHSVGWIGVDLFFALSAFLFVKLLAKEYDQTGTIKIGKFYIRRALRIWPIYALYCLLMMVVSNVFGGVPLWSWRAFGLFTFTDNIFTAFGGYNPSVHATGHLWTISYEEQFYLFIPILLLFLFKSPRSRVVLSLSTIAVAFTVFRIILIWLNAPHPAIWVLPVTHFESMLLGIVVGLGGFHVVFSRVPALAILAAALGFGWLVTRAAPLDAIDWNLTTSYPLIGLCTSLSLYFVFRTGRQRWMRWLSLPPNVFLGKISYGLYVYHSFVLELTQRLIQHSILQGRLPFSEPVAIFVGALGLTVAVASASYMLIEKPFLRLKRRYEVIASRPA